MKYEMTGAECRPTLKLRMRAAAPMRANRQTPVSSTLSTMELRRLVADMVD
jgi:hypothetical protein